MKRTHTNAVKTLAAAAVALSLCACGSTSSDSRPDIAADTAANETAANNADDISANTTAAAEAVTLAAIEAPAEANSLTSLEVIRLMGNGINLGNTLEAYDHKGYLNGTNPDGMERGWGQPYTTAEMIRGMKDAGFDTLRIPVAWTNGMNYESGDYTIDERLMTRVETVVRYALDADMYVIVNDHWDGSWWGMFGAEDMETRDKAMEMYKSMWSQIGERFKDYPYKLIFESANEELGDRLNDADVTGSDGVLNTNECYETTNLINSEFVKLIRSQGGANADRFLLIAGYNTDIAKTCDDRFKMPEDTADSKLLLSVHYYTPWDYCGTDSVNTWGSPKDYEEQNGLMEDLSKFSDAGYGVVIGEYAVMMKNGGIKPETDKFYDNILDNCDLYDFCPVLWDCNNFYKRLTNTTSDEALAKLFDERRLANESNDIDAVKSAAKDKIEATYEASQSAQMEGIEFPPSDDMAIAWLMFNSSDYGIAYSVGDTYDPTNATTGVKATNVQVIGAGTYTVSLDFSESGAAKGMGFCALGMSNGESFFPGCKITVDEILINGEAQELTAKGYTSSDDDKCTRVNIVNQWVKNVPADGRTSDGSLDGCSATILGIGENTRITSVEVTFTVEE
ncbi:MAG: glycoside hydrolase family 5 protein [Ruminococcus sp.]|nr:glycoside hydrolase family 5 protein [Ruminococcus sp.]